LACMYVYFCILASSRMLRHDPCDKPIFIRWGCQRPLRPPHPPCQPGTWWLSSSPSSVTRRPTSTASPPTPVSGLIRMSCTWFCLSHGGPLVCSRTMGDAGTTSQGPQHRFPPPALVSHEYLIAWDLLAGGLLAPFPWDVAQLSVEEVESMTHDFSELNC
jgi:hypothetical protein